MMRTTRQELLNDLLTLIDQADGNKRKVENITYDAARRVVVATFKDRTKKEVSTGEYAGSLFLKKVVNMVL